MLDTVRSPHLGIIMDGANVFPKGTLTRQHEILDQAFDLLGGDIVSAHAKDLSRDGDAGHEAAGTGLLDYDYYVKLLAQSNYDGAVLLHSLTEDQAPGCIAFLRAKMAR
ncbi:MAG: TIM barrel protein [Caldilineaceae bacterium]